MGAAERTAGPQSCHQPSQGSPKPPPSRPAGSSKQRRRSQRALPAASCVACWALYLPLALLLVLLALGPCPAAQAARRLAAWPAAGRAWRIGCSWGGVAVLLSAQAAYARSRWRLGAALDGLYLVLLTGEARHVLPAASASAQPCLPCLLRRSSWCTRGPLRTLCRRHAAQQALPMRTGRLVCLLRLCTAPDTACPHPPQSSLAVCCRGPASALPAAAALLACRLLMIAAALSCSPRHKGLRQRGSQVHLSRQQLGRTAPP